MVLAVDRVKVIQIPHQESIAMSGGVHGVYRIYSRG